MAVKAKEYTSREAPKFNCEYVDIRVNDTTGGMCGDKAVVLHRTVVCKAITNYNPIKKGDELILEVECPNVHTDTRRTGRGRRRHE